MTPTTEAFDTGLRAEFEAWAKERGHPLCDVIPKYGPASAMSETVLRFSDIAWEAYRAATERAAKQEWQPIETAPRDGTKFLALRRDEIAIAWLLVRDDGDIWNFGRTSACPEVFPSIVPTHWMPLPAAPDAAAIRASGGKGASDV